MFEVVLGSKKNFESASKKLIMLIWYWNVVQQIKCRHENVESI